MMIGVLLMLPQMAAAKVYMCVDPVSGKTSFTDKACETNSVIEEVRVDATNLDSGRSYAGAPRAKYWSSEKESRKSGLDYNAERRNLYERKATAAAQ